MPLARMKWAPLPPPSPGLTHYVHAVPGGEEIMLLLARVRTLEDVLREAKRALPDVPMPNRHHLEQAISRAEEAR